jgi:hypothetical protein
MAEQSLVMTPELLTGSWMKTVPLDAIQVSKEIIPSLEGVKNAVFKILAITKIFLIVDHTKIQCTIEIIQKTIYKRNIQPQTRRHVYTFSFIDEYRLA